MEEPISLFQIPIRLQPEERRTVKATFSSGSCVIQFPRSMLGRKTQLLTTLDHVYWRLLGKLALPDLQRRTAELNNIYFNFDYRGVRYHRQFRRWGSCSDRGNINLSHRLIGGPRDLMDYVILHELAHLQYLNHGPDFWKLLRSTGEDPQRLQSAMTVYGREWQYLYENWYHRLYQTMLSTKPKK